MPAVLADEHRCLRRLIAGADAWPEFLDLFGAFIYKELAQFGLYAGHDRDDLLQELACKLIAREWAILQRHLSAYEDVSFRLVLRTIIRSCLVNHWRRNKRWQALEALADEPSAAELIDTSWAADPALAAYRDVRLMCLLHDIAGLDRDGRNYRILFLRIIEGESVIEIAGRLGLSANAVSQRLRECLRRGRIRLDASKLADQPRRLR
jgi:RNA polymerase sigma factor (sigma-70 family)